MPTLKSRRSGIDLRDGYVANEHDGWWWYPVDDAPAGPFGTRKAAEDMARELIATKQEAKGNLVFRDDDGKPVAILDTSNLN